MSSWYIIIEKFICISVNILSGLYVCIYTVRVESNVFLSVFSNFVLRNGVSMELMRFPLENTHSTWVRRVARLPGVGEDRSQSFFFFSSRGNVSRGQEWYESRGLVSSRDGPRDSIGQMWCAWAVGGEWETTATCNITWRKTRSESGHVMFLHLFGLYFITSINPFASGLRLS